jgi:predicted alpha/beta-hydrolase family hydrolase
MTPARICRWLPALLLLTMAASIHAETATSSITTARGAVLNLRIDLPPVDGPVPALVLAPGQNYHMGQPALEQTAKAVSSAGVAVFRFDWAYFGTTPRGKPSEDLTLELEDLRAVLAFAREHPRVKGRPLVVGGKSLGSIVAWRAFAEDERLRGVVLLTPLCSRKDGDGAVQYIGAETYAGLADAFRPQLLVAGKNDALCEPGSLLRLAKESPLSHVSLVEGDHGFEDRRLAPDMAEAFRAKQLQVVGVEVARFVRALTGGGAHAP